MTANEAAIRAAAEDIAKYIDSTTPLSVGDPMLRMFENIIRRHLSASVPEQPCAQCDCTHASAYELGRADERALHVPEQSPRVCVKCGRSEFASDTPRTHECEFPASPSITDQ